MISFKMFDPQYEPEIVSDIWEDLRPNVQKALRFWEHVADIMDVERLVANGMVRIISIHWSVATVGYMLVEPAIYPKKRKLKIIYFQSKDYQHVIPAIIEPFKYFVIEIAKFDGIETLCRPGLARLLNKAGLKSQLVRVVWNG